MFESYHLLKNYLKTGEFPTLASQHLQPSRGQGDGVTVNQVGNDGAMILIVGYFDNENQARLVRRDGSIVKKWTFDYFKDFAKNQRACDLEGPLGVDMHGVVLRPNGEIVANYEYCGTVKHDRCDKVVWALDRMTNHSIVPAENGGYWVVGRQTWNAGAQPDRMPPFSSRGSKTMLLDDTIMRLSEDGKVLTEVSIPQLMRQNGLEALLSGNGVFYRRGVEPRAEIIHTNKVAELSTAMAAAFPQFAEGDLLVSVRTLNMLFVVDPRTWKIKWHQTGPFLRQHDAEFDPNGMISVFNNNTYGNNADETTKTDLSRPKVTNIMALDPRTGGATVLFGMKPGQEMLSDFRGDHQLTADGGMLITEFAAGRVIEVKDGKVVWEYIDRHDAKHVGEITNALRIDPGYLKVDLNAC